MSSLGLVEEMSSSQNIKAIIVDSKLETIYILHAKEVGWDNLEDFIYRFHHHTDTLTKLKRIKTDIPELIPNPGALSSDPGSNSPVYDADRLVSREINSVTFAPDVLNSTQNVVLLYTSGKIWSNNQRFNLEHDH